VVDILTDAVTREQIKQSVAAGGHPRNTAVRVHQPIELGHHPNTYQDSSTAFSNTAPPIPPYFGENWSWEMIISQSIVIYMLLCIFVPWIFCLTFVQSSSEIFWRWHDWLLPEVARLNKMGGNTKQDKSGGKELKRANQSNKTATNQSNKTTGKTGAGKSGKGPKTKATSQEQQPAKQQLKKKKGKESKTHESNESKARASKTLGDGNGAGDMAFEGLLQQQREEEEGTEEIVFRGRPAQKRREAEAKPKKKASLSIGPDGKPVYSGPVLSIGEEFRAAYHEKTEEEVQVRHSPPSPSVPCLPRSMHCTRKCAHHTTHNTHTHITQTTHSARTQHIRITSYTLTTLRWRQIGRI
jgi:hypothetical protein